MKILVASIILIISVIDARPQDPSDGKYYPELFGQYLGYYQHDDRGRYIHDYSGSSGSPSSFGSTSNSRFGSNSDVSASRFGKFDQSTGVRVGNSLNGALRSNSQHTSVVSSNPNSHFVLNSVHQSSGNYNEHDSNAAIAAIGISSSFLPPLLEDSDEFGGFLPNVVSTSGFTSNGNGNFGGSSTGSVFSGGNKASIVSQSTITGTSDAKAPAISTQKVSSNAAKTGLSSKTGSNANKSSFSGSKSSSLPNSAFGGARLSIGTVNNQNKVFGQNYANAYGDYKILRQESATDEDGYHYQYETENNIQAEETGHLAKKGTDDAHIEANGYYEYVGPDGVTYRVDYTADENGFQPVGNHLPVPPPIPEAIQKALAAQGIYNYP